jgi:hypothetical protein
MDYLKKDEVIGSNLLESTILFLSKKYKQARKLFSFSSAYGQLIIVIKNISQYLYYYMNDVAVQNNFHTADRKHSVFGLAELNGHSALRGKSAIGEVSIKFKENFPLETISGNLVYIPNFSRLRCLANNLEYILDINQDFLIINSNTKNSIKAKIIQGKLDFQSFRGDGEDLQSYQVQLQPSDITDHDFIIVMVNGKKYPIYESLMDIPLNQPGCLIKNTVDNGFAVVFGKSSVHEIPQKGSEIIVNYLLSDGANGNIIKVNYINYIFLDSGIDASGNDVNLNDFLYVTNSMPPDFGANPESIELTKLIGPKVQKNAIIHDKNSIEYYFYRMNYFRVVRAKRRENNDNMNHYDTMVIPDLRLRIAANEDYFNVPIDKFLLSKLEKDRLLTSLIESYRLSSNINLNIISPKLKRFALTLFIKAYKIKNGVITNEQILLSKIRSMLSEYMINNSRINIIPHSDIVRVIDEIDEVDSVKVVFFPQYKEDVDQFGDIVVKENELAILRGNFITEDGIEFIDTFNNSEENSVVTINIEYIS